MDVNQQSVSGGANDSKSFVIPPVPLVAVEHPFIVRDLSRAVQSLGGDQQVRILTQEDSKWKPARLSLRPEDPFSRTIESCVIRGTNAIMQIEVPRRTGRRRKRGSSGPFIKIDTPNSSQEEQLLRAFRDNPERSTVEVIGQVDRTHRFRDPPDFAWATSTNHFLKRFRNTLLSPSYEEISKFRMDPENQSLELIPPPIIAPSTIPWAYFYRQSASIKTVEIGGQKRTFNTSLHERRGVINIRCDERNIPNPSGEDLEKAFKELNSHDQKLVMQIRKHFDTRPVWTRRGLINMLRAEGMHQQQLEHHIYAQVAYTFSSGPWRDTVVRYGIDPRKEPDLRIYQTMAFRTDDIVPRRAEHTAVGTIQAAAGQDRGKADGIHAEEFTQPSSSTHIFDGQSIDISGKVWQMCDVTDVTVKTLLESAQVREICDVKSSGWYCNGTWAKARAILKAKIRHLLETGKPLDDGRSRHIRHILRIPDVIDENNLSETFVGRAPHDRGLAKITEGIRTRARGSFRADVDIEAVSNGFAKSRIPPVDSDEAPFLSQGVTRERGDDVDGVSELLRDVQRGAEEEDGESNDEEGGANPRRAGVSSVPVPEPDKGQDSVMN